MVVDSPHESLDRLQWFHWHTQLDELSHTLSGLFHSSLDRETRMGLFLVPRDMVLPNGTTVRGHFDSVACSVMLHWQHLEYLGLIECNTVAINLLNDAERSACQLAARAEEIKEVLRRVPGERQDYDSQSDVLNYRDADGMAGSMMGTRCAATALEEVRQRIRAHREYVQNMLPRLPSPEVA